MKLSVNSAKEFCTFATCSLLVLLSACLEHTGDAFKWSMMNGDVLQNRIRLLLNCSYFVFFFPPGIGLLLCGLEFDSFFQKNLSCVDEWAHRASPAQGFVTCSFLRKTELKAGAWIPFDFSGKQSWRLRLTLLVIKPKAKAQVQRCSETRGETMEVLQSRTRRCRAAGARGPCPLVWPRPLPPVTAQGRSCRRPRASPCGGKRYSQVFFFPWPGICAAQRWSPSWNSLCSVGKEQKWAFSVATTVTTDYWACGVRCNQECLITRAGIETFPGFSYGWSWANFSDLPPTSCWSHVIHSPGFVLTTAVFSRFSFCEIWGRTCINHHKS